MRMRENYKYTSCHFQRVHGKEVLFEIYMLICKCTGSCVTSVSRATNDPPGGEVQVGRVDRLGGRVWPG